MLSETRKVAKHRFPVVRNQQPVFTSSDGENLRVWAADDARIPGSLEIEASSACPVIGSRPLYRELAPFTSVSDVAKTKY